MSKPLQVIVIGLGSAGDVHPNVGLALALRERGHEVLLAAPSVFQSLGEHAGLEFAAILSDDEYHAAIRDPNLWHPFRSLSVVARRLILPTLRPVYQIIEKHWEPGRTVIAAPGFAFGARIAQEKLGVPLATVHLQPIMFRSAIQPGCFGFPDILGHLLRPLRRLYLRATDQFLIDPLVADETNSFRLELRLPPVRRLFNGWVHSPQLIIGLFPEVCDARTRLAFQRCAYRVSTLGRKQFAKSLTWVGRISSSRTLADRVHCGFSHGTGRILFPSIGRGVPNLWPTRTLFDAVFWATSDAPS